MKRKTNFDTTMILSRLKAGYWIYYRHQEEELKIEHLNNDRFIVTQAEYLGDTRRRELDTLDLQAFLV